MLGSRLASLAGWQVVIGIETHVKLSTKHKLFSCAPTALSFNRSNTFLDLHDAAFPGTLPKLNPDAVALAIRTALALKCSIARTSSFDRKHYFYHDLPAGYQITQYYAPIAQNGVLPIGSAHAPIRIKQIHLEQDTGKTNTVDGRTLVDLNRAGQGLLEIVTQPDMSSPEEAAWYVKVLQSVLRTVGASDGNMELGSLRVDVNVSVNPPNAERASGTRCEIKNLNSVKSVVGAIEHEITRQQKLLTASPPQQVEQLTLTYDATSGETVPMRSKEDSPDYRYMPDPNLGILQLSEDHIDSISKSLPELPWETRSRLREAYGLSARSIGVLMDLEHDTPTVIGGEVVRPISFFERVCNGEKLDGSIGNTREPSVVANWMLNTLLSHLATRNMQNPLSPGQFGAILDMIILGQLTGTSAKFLIRSIFAESDNSARTLNPLELAKKLELLTNTETATQSSDLEIVCSEVLDEMPTETTALASGRHPNVVHKIVGVVMKRTKGKADAQTVAEIVRRLAADATADAGCSSAS